LGTIASVQGYSRELETEADTEGFRLVVAANYDPAETAKLFARLKEDVEDRKDKEPFFFGSHPRLQERIENYEKLQAHHSGRGGVKNADIFSQKIRGIMLVDAQLNLSTGNFKAAQREMERSLFMKPADADAHFILGEVFRQRNEGGDMEKAISAYRQSISCNPSYAAPFKSLGLIHLKKGEKPLAKEHLQRYLTLSPEANDRTYIIEYIKRCD
jgi:predicted Zn-dependent protease